MNKTKSMEPHFEEVQAHYDLSDDFYALWLDPRRVYSCAYYRSPGMTLAQAQEDGYLAACEILKRKADIDARVFTRDEILKAIAKYEGAIVLVTHDEGAVQALNPERVLLMPDGDEDLWNDSYLDLVAEE